MAFQLAFDYTKNLIYSKFCPRFFAYLPTTKATKEEMQHKLKCTFQCLSHPFPRSFSKCQQWCWLMLQLKKLLKRKHKSLFSSSSQLNYFHWESFEREKEACPTSSSEFQVSKCVKLWCKEKDFPSKVLSFCGKFCGEINTESPAFRWIIYMPGSIASNCSFKAVFKSINQLY